MKVISVYTVRRRGRVIAVELDHQAALCRVGGHVSRGGDCYTIIGVERNRANRPLAPGDCVGLLLDPEPAWGEGEEVVLVPAADVSGWPHET